MVIGMKLIYSAWMLKQCCQLPKPTLAAALGWIFMENGLMIMMAACNSWQQQFPLIYYVYYLHVLVLKEQQQSKNYTCMLCYELNI
mmetsp:Transcript_25310/g.34996  ORF Transcript_25310/g.34996 Transcript_25310/m.34996 type:complete len:86 (+) Transcript_25310:280-537(+)